jgi:flagellar biosynthesis GTPase FlhF
LYIVSALLISKTKTKTEHKEEIPGFKPARFFFRELSAVLVFWFSMDFVGGSYLSSNKNVFSVYSVQWSANMVGGKAYLRGVELYIICRSFCTTIMAFIDKLSGLKCHFNRIRKSSNESIYVCPFYKDLKCQFKALVHNVTGAERTSGEHNHTKEQEQTLKNRHKLQLVLSAENARQVKLQLHQPEIVERERLKEEKAQQKKIRELQKEELRKQQEENRRKREVKKAEEEERKRRRQQIRRANWSEKFQDDRMRRIEAERAEEIKEFLIEELLPRMKKAVCSLKLLIFNEFDTNMFV